MPIALMLLLIADADDDICLCDIFALYIMTCEGAGDACSGHIRLFILSISRESRLCFFVFDNLAESIISCRIISLFRSAFLYQLMAIHRFNGHHALLQCQYQAIFVGDFILLSTINYL